MNMFKGFRKRYFIAIAMLLCVGLYFVGYKTFAQEKKVAKKKHVRIAFIDSDQLLGDFPEIKKFAEDKTLESEKIRKTMMERLSGGGQLTDAEKAQIKASTKKFMEKEDKLLKEFIDKVRIATQKVADEKKIDIVLDNKTTDPIIEYGGVNITEDVRLKIKEMQSAEAKKK